MRVPIPFPGNDRAGDTMKVAGALGTEKCPAGLGFLWKNSRLAGLLQVAHWDEKTSGEPHVVLGVPEGFGPTAWCVTGEESNTFSGPAEAFLPMLGFGLSLQAFLTKAFVFPCSPQPFLCD